MAKTGLVLEGGGMRGLFTAGVLDYFIDEGIDFPYIIGVSAGVCHGINFVSKQRGRTRDININNIRDKRYVSFQNFLKTGSLFGMDFIFDEIPNNLYPFDFETFNSSKTEFVSGVTDIHTGKPVYFGREKNNSINQIARASSSLPVFSPIVPFEGGQYLDGGTSDPIPLRKALADGCEKLVVILTRDSSFVRQPEKFRFIYHRMYHKFPEMIRCLDKRHETYNETREYLKELVNREKAFVIAPPEPVAIGRFERDTQKLTALYQQGYDEAKRIHAELAAFLNDSENN